MINPYKPRVLFVGHKQTVQTHDEMKNEKHKPSTLKMEMDWSNR